MQLGLSIAVALLILAVVAWPLLARRRNPPGGANARPTTPPADADAAADANRAAALNDVYDSIRALQTDHSLGRVNDHDYQQQFDEYRRQAARILRDLDRSRNRDADTDTNAG